MCDYFWQRMENDQGDLEDIVRASNRAGGPGIDFPVSDWQLPSEPVSFSRPATDGSREDFNDAFGSLGDSSLLHDLSASSFFKGGGGDVIIADPSRMSADGGDGGRSSGGDALLEQKILREEMRRPCNIFSRVLQIAPGAGKQPLMPPRGIKASQIVTGPMDNAGMQISSPRTPGIKRRKSQAKKVVCIPAPQAASSRASGEVVPSDLWAWRKYGQKPIKGSPYPRGYYRCSSSKGCSARKQVERSRTDPNMLVITYTSEHNHPWPTQRNALAGSTRSQPSKSGSSAHKNSLKQATTLKEEPKDTTCSSTYLVKEEVGELDKAMELSDEQKLDQMFDVSYEPLIQESDQPDDFFADLAELEPDPMNLIFSKGFIGGEKADEERETKAIDPFNVFDWGGNLFGESKEGL